ncbi:hypothetical protein IJ541_08700 [bacterium]|nr:hypothetical protein [bacterium]MBQ9246919.1 hypothetical protein [bacterium]
MKKLLPLLLFSAMLIPVQSLEVFAAETNAKQETQSVVRQKPSKEEMRKQFEQRLNLSDKQKEKAKAIHQKGHEEMKPVMMQIALKHQELKNLKTSDLSEQAKTEKTEQLKAEIKELDKQAQEIRKKNTQEFEKILNKKQKAELEKMKAEGRARFEKHHPPRPPFQGLGAPSFLFPPKTNFGSDWK